MLDVADVRQSAELAGEVDSVSDDEFVADLEAQVVDVDFGLQRLGFEKKRAALERRGLARAQARS